MSRARFNAGHFGREVVLDMCKDGTLTYRHRTMPSFNGVALPVFSVDTVEQAKEAQVLFCRKQYVAHPQLPGQPWYRWTDFDGEVSSLEQVSKRLAEWRLLSWARWAQVHSQRDRARAFIRKVQAAGVEVGSGVDLLLDNMPDLRDVAEAQALLTTIGYQRGVAL